MPPPAKPRDAFVAPPSHGQELAKPAKLASSEDGSSSEPAPVTALLFSGGLDSAILLGRLLQEQAEIVPLYIRSDVVWQPAEQRAVDRLLQQLRTPRLASLVQLDMPLGDLYGEHWCTGGWGTPDAGTPDEAVYLPGRNPLLLIKALVWCRLHGIPRLAIALLRSNPFADATPEFFQAFERAIDLAVGGRVSIARPFAELSKLEVMRLGAGLPLELTFSCIDPLDGLHCGVCNKCGERQAAFQAAQMEDRTLYASRLQPAK